MGIKINLQKGKRVCYYERKKSNAYKKYIDKSVDFFLHKIFLLQNAINTFHNL